MKNKLDKSEKPLTLQQEAFCRNFVTAGEFFGNGTQSYIDAYGIDVTKKGAYNNARVMAHHNLTNVNIIKRINALLEDIGFNDNNADKQLWLVMNQSSDFGAKVAAIREYNKLKKRIDDNTSKVVPSVTININKTYITGKNGIDANSKANKVLG